MLYFGYTTLTNRLVYGKRFRFRKNATLIHDGYKWHSVHKIFVQTPSTDRTKKPFPDVDLQNTTWNS